MTSVNDLHQTSYADDRFRGKIQRTFLFVFIPLSLLPIVIIGSIVFLRARDLLVEQIHVQIDNSLNIVASDIDSWTTNSQIRLESAFRFADTQAALNRVFLPYARAEPSFMADRTEILSRLNSLNQETGNIKYKDFIVLSSAGEIMISTEEAWEGIFLTELRYKNLYSDTAGTFIDFDLAPLSIGQIIILSHVPSQGADKADGYIIGLLSPNRLLEILTSVAKFQPDAQSYLTLNERVFIGLDYYVEELDTISPSQSQINTLMPVIEAFSTNPAVGEHTNLTIRSFDGTQSIASIAWLSSLATGLVVEVPQSLVFQNLQSLTPYTFYTLAVMIVIFSIVIGLAARGFSQPLLSLTETTRQFSQGKWDLRVPETRNDEIGLLAYTFNHMANDLSNLYRSLSTQVEEQTEELQTRSSQLEATAQVAREAAAIHDLDTLLSHTTELISQNFGFYHAGIFLLDEEKEFAILQATNSEGGQRMLDRGHKLAVGQTGVVGLVADTGIPRIALDVGEDSYYFDNPDLPETRSEMALPLKTQDEIIGILDVQSKIPGAFSDSDLEVLQIMADQITLAIENALLIEQTEQTVRQLRVLYNQRLQEGWHKTLSGQTKAFHFDRVRVKSAPAAIIETFREANKNEVEVYLGDDGKQIMNIPINLRGQILGGIVLRRNPDEPSWTKEDQDLAQEVSGQIAMALENARLLEESQRRATQEELLSQASARFSQSLNIDTVLQMAVRELGQLSGVSEVTVELSQE
jgi:GAF domain-containing protein/HAMP domain-containing protein